MKRRTGLIVLLALAVGLPLTHLELQSDQEGWLLVVDGRPVDVAGQVQEAWIAMTRDCRRVQSLAPGDALWVQALEVLRQHSPPHSRSANIVSALHQDGWLLARVQFNGLQTALVPMQLSPNGATVAERGIWSGETHPYRPRPFIGRYIGARLPDLPRSLLDCMD